MALSRRQYGCVRGEYNPAQEGIWPRSGGQYGIFHVNLNKRTESVLTVVGFVIVDRRLRTRTGLYSRQLSRFARTDLQPAAALLERGY